MKKALFVCLALALLAALLCAVPASAEEFTEGDWTYDIDRGNARIQAYDGEATILDIPDKLGGYPVTEIGAWVFMNNDSLTKVTIPAGVTRISTCAFYNCVNLRIITIPESLNGVAQSAFEDDEHLSHIYFAGTEAQWNAIFINDSGNDPLKNATLHFNQALPGPEDFWTYEVNDGKATITAYDGVEAILEIPATLGGHPVTAIGDQVFLNNSSLTQVTIPAGVTSIGEIAFYGCESLLDITIPASVTSIGEGAFDGCPVLCSLTVDAENSSYSSMDSVLFSKDGTILLFCPEGKAGAYTVPACVTAIADGAFESCSALMSVTIPGNVASIGENAFSDCVNLESVTIQNGVTSIGDYAFSYCESLPNISIPASITSIGEGAFCGCLDLESVTIQGSITSIADRTFDACWSLSEIAIPASVKSIGERAFWDCSKLSEITIPVSVKKIEDDAFCYCKVLKDVYYDGTQSQWDAIIIGENNAPLESAELHCKEDDPDPDPDPEPDYDRSGTCGEKLKWGFLESTGTLTVYGKGAMTDYDLLENPAWKDWKDTIKSVVIRQGVTSIGSYAFRECENLESLSVPVSLVKIGENAFYGAATNHTYAWTDLGSLPSDSLILSIEYAGSYAQWQEISIGSGNGEIWKAYVRYADAESDPQKIAASGYCDKNLNWILDTSGKLSVSGEGDLMVEMQFAADTWNGLPKVEVTSIVIGSGVTRISQTALSNFKNLSALTLPETLTSIGNYAFRFNPALTEITLPASLTKLGDNVFESCSALRTIRVAEGSASFCTVDGALLTKDLKNVICLPAASGKTSYTIPSGAENIYGSAFRGCASLTEVVIPEGVTTIGSYAFDSTGLKSVTLPASTAEVSTGVFSDCSSLTKISVRSGCAAFRDIDGVLFNKAGTVLWAFPSGRNGNYDIPEGVTGIREFAFYACRRLESASVPEGVTEIPQYAFNNCNELKLITLPASLASIGNYAFSGCFKLTDVDFCGSGQKWDAITINVGNEVIENAMVNFNMYGGKTSIKGAENGVDANGDLICRVSIGCKNDGRTIYAWAARYDEDGRLIDITQRELTPGRMNELTVYYEDATTIRIFALEDESCAPVCASVKMEAA